MESTGQKNKIQLSEDTAKLLTDSGHHHWIQPRSDLVDVKGKGECQTYWLMLGNTSTGSHVSSNPTDDSGESGLLPKAPGQSTTTENHLIWEGTYLEGVLGQTKIDQKLRRLLDWNVDVMLSLLKRVVAVSRARGQGRASLSLAAEKSITAGKGTARDQLQMVIRLPDFDPEIAEKAMEEVVDLDPAAIQELRDYVAAIVSGYPKNPFHDFEHASHVILSATKLLKRIVNPSETDLTPQDVHDHTFGIASDPLCQFAIVFSALIHDVGHPGCPNGRLAGELGGNCCSGSKAASI